MNREVVIAQLKNRINVLSNRSKENSRIVMKLNRKLRKLESQTS